MAYKNPPPSDTRIEISEIVEGVVWLQYVHEGREIFKVPLAQAIRDYLRDAYQKDIDDGEVARGFAPTRSFAKLSISKAFNSELMRA